MQNPGGGGIPGKMGPKIPNGMPQQMGQIPGQIPGFQQIQGNVTNPQLQLQQQFMQLQQQNQQNQMQMQPFNQMQAFPQMNPQMQFPQMQMQFQQQQRTMKPRQNTQKFGSQQFPFMMPPQGQVPTQNQKLRRTKSSVPKHLAPPTPPPPMSIVMHPQGQQVPQNPMNVQQQMQAMNAQMQQQKNMQNKTQAQQQQKVSKQQTTMQAMPQMPVRPPMPNITGMPQTPQNRPVGYPPKNDQKQVPVPQQGMTSMVPQPINVPAIPQTMPQMMSQNVPEAHYIHQLVKNLDKERADLFFRLFNCKKQKRSEDRPEIFMQNVFPALRNATPNIGVVICRLIESLRLQQDTYTKLLEPPIPIVFSRLKQHKPLYSLVQIAPPSGVELTPTNKDRRTELIPIGTFVSLMEPYPQNVPIVVDKNEVKPLKYGTADQSFYVAAPPGKAPPRFVIHFTAPPPSFLTWFTLQFVEYRQPKDILQELLASKNIPFNSLPVLARTPKCNGCSFDAIKVIEEIINTGSAQCPTCHENIVLTDLEFDLPQPQSARMIVSEDEAALTLAKLALADQVCALSPAAVEARSWSDMIFGGVGQAQGEYHPMVYNDTQEYVSTILSMN